MDSSSKNQSSFSPSPGGYMSLFPKLTLKKPITILVEGNIGAGKSTFLDYFLQYEDNFQILPEPVDQWRNFNGVNLLVCAFFLVFLIEGHFC